MATTKVALITASSAGLGAAIAKALIPTHRVVINYFSNADRANDVLKSLSTIAPPSSSTGGIRFHSIKADVGDRADITRLVEETVALWGRLDVVISNAGWTKMTNFMDLDDNMEEDVWDRCFTVNVKSHLWLMHAAKKYLEESEGCFVSTASVAGVKPSGSSLPYAVTKAAQIHLMKSLAVIGAPKIRVNSVSPGVLMTDWGMKFPPAKLEASKAKTQLKRFATVEDVADQVKCLVESKSMTGQNIVVDSGFSL